MAAMTIKPTISYANCSKTAIISPSISLLIAFLKLRHIPPTFSSLLAYLEAKNSEKRSCLDFD